MTNPRDTDGSDKSRRGGWWATTWADKVAVHQHSIVILFWVGVGCERALIIFWPNWQSIPWKFMVRPGYCFMSGQQIFHVTAANIFYRVTAWVTKKDLQKTCD